MRRTAKDISKTLWTFEDSPPEREAIKIGCMQRIADACELMARDRERMVRDLDFYKKQHEQEYLRRRKAEKSISALKGQITKLKSKMKAAD